MLATVFDFIMYGFVIRENNEKLWLRREAEAQEEFARKKLEEERKIKQKDEQEVIFSYFDIFQVSRFTVIS